METWVLRVFHVGILARLASEAAVCLVVLVLFHSKTCQLTSSINVNLVSVSSSASSFFSSASPASVNCPSLNCGRPRRAV